MKLNKNCDEYRGQLMSIEQFDVLRGYLMAAVILSLVTTGLVGQLQSRVARTIRVVTLSVGAIAALGLFFILCFVAGWDEYFAAKAIGAVHGEYHGRHRTAARVISTLGELRASGLGLVFGAIGIIFGVSAVLTGKSLRRRQ